MDKYNLELNYDEISVIEYILHNLAEYNPGEYKFSSLYGDVIFIPNHI